MKGWTARRFERIADTLDMGHAAARLHDPGETSCAAWRRRLCVRDLTAPPSPVRDDEIGRLLRHQTALTARRPNPRVDPGSPTFSTTKAPSEESVLPAEEGGFERIYSRETTPTFRSGKRWKRRRPACFGGGHLDHTVTSFIPNTAESSFYGLIHGLEEHLNTSKIARIKGLGADPDHAEIESILNERPRIDKIAIKDAKLRTFITEDSSRDDLVAHVYDITYGTVERGVDNLVVIDDSIVRGTTLKKSILRILDRLGPKRIVVASSAPQIRYPDCYGIDMARMGDFIAFQAAVSLLKERGMEDVLQKTYEACKHQLTLPLKENVNQVKAIYAPFTDEEISNRISDLLTPTGMQSEVKIIFQSVEGLHEACPDHLGDWYFTGDFPTPGGHRVVNKAFVYYMEGNDARAY